MFSSGFTVEHNLVSTITLKIEGVDALLGRLESLFLILKIDI